jgi:outer membrane protein assembly factor BamB
MESVSHRPALIKPFASGELDSVAFLREDTRISMKDQSNDFEEERSRMKLNRFPRRAVVFIFLILVLVGLAVSVVKGPDNMIGGSDRDGPATIGARVTDEVASIMPAGQSLVSASGIYVLTHEFGGPFLVKKIDLKTRKVVWIYAVGDAPAKVSIGQGVVYVTSQVGSDGYVYALDARDGALFWKANLGSDVRAGTSLDQLSSAIVANDTLYTTATDGAVIALNVKNGSKKWMKDIQTTTLDVLSTKSSAIYGTYPVSVVNGIVFGAIHNKLFALDGRSGKEIWIQTIRDDQIFMSPLVADGVVYVDSFGEQKAGEQSPPPLDPGGYVYAFDVRSGRQLWSKQTSAVSSSLIVANGKVVYGASDGFIHALNASGGEVWKAKGSGPFLFQGASTIGRTPLTGGQESVGL